MNKKLLILLTKFDDLFGGTLLKWYTNPVNLEVKPGYKPFNDRCYPVPKIDKEAFGKELQRLVDIDVLTPVHKLQ